VSNFDGNNIGDCLISKREAKINPKIEM